MITPEISIANGGSYEVTGSSSDTIAFAGNTGTLTLDHPSSFTGEIAGSFAIGDIVDLAGFSATDTATTGAGSFNSATDETTLTVKDSGGNVVETFALAGDHSSSSWTVTSDLHGGIDIVDPRRASGAKNGACDGNDCPRQRSRRGVGPPEWVRPCREPGQRRGIRRRSALGGDLGHS